MDMLMVETLIVHGAFLMVVLYILLGGFQYNWLSIEPVAAQSVWNPDHPTLVRHPHVVQRKVQAVLQSYDFMLVVDRMEESVVALALVMGIPLSHVVLSNAKVAASAATNQTKKSDAPTPADDSGGYILSRFGRHKGQCTRPGTQPMSRVVREYLSSSPTWLARTYADQLLYRAANASLDRTIARLGPDRFARALHDYRQWQGWVQTYCGFRIGSGCTRNGKPLLPMEACYDRDFGCGYQCIDQAVAQLEAAQQALQSTT